MNNLICWLPLLVVVAMLVIGVIGACMRSSQISHDEEERFYTWDARRK